MKVQAELNSLVEGNLRLPGAVNVTRVLGLHDPLLVVQLSLNHTVSDGLGHDELRVLRHVHVELLGDVCEGDLAVGETDGLDSSLDDVMVESGDEGVGVVCSELSLECLQHISEPLHLT